MFRIELWNHESQRHDPAAGGAFVNAELATEALSDLPCLAGARIVNALVAPGRPGHIHIEHPVFEVVWCNDDDTLRGYPEDYVELAVEHGLPLEAFLQGDEMTPVHDAAGEVIGWMSSP